MREHTRRGDRAGGRRSAAAAPRAAVLAATLTAALTACSPLTPAQGEHAPQVAEAGAASASHQTNAANPAGPAVTVAATTPIIADIARQVGGPRAQVTGLIPPQADPHVFEPRLSTVRAIAHADVLLSNGLMLEEQSMLRALESHQAPGARHIVLGEEVDSAGGYLAPLVENAALDTVWLGFRVAGRGPDQAAVRLRVLDHEGPGEAHAFITGTFGEPERLLSTAQPNLEARLPHNAHTHVSWGFSAAGHYQLRLAADLIDAGSGELLRPVATTTLRFAVGVNPPAGTPAEGILDEGHQDLTVDLAAERFTLTGDAQREVESTTVVVPPATLQLIPTDPAYRFLGRPQQPVYLLHQAVLGKHVHGDTDPHLWLDPVNGRAMAQVIADTLSATDPEGRAGYQQRAHAYQQQLAAVEAEMHAVLGAIPEHHRHLVSTHDGFGYLGRAFDLDVAGFVTPTATTSPSPRDLARLRETLRGLGVPAVFVEPAASAHTKELQSTARDVGVEVCTLNGDAFGPGVDSYLELLRRDAATIGRCLTPAPASASAPPVSSPPAPPPASASSS